MQSLYDKYGGFAKVQRVVGVFYDKIMDSENLDKYFANINLQRLIDHQIKFLSMVLGGPAEYTGRALEVAHQRLNIDEASFAEVGKLLAESLECEGFSAEDVQTVMTVVVSVKDKIVSASLA